MSGIAAIFNLDGRPADRRLLTAMLDTIPYRGPDWVQMYVEGPVGLGYASMHTTPEAITEVQPRVRDGLCALLDGRIDNRDELQALLEGKKIRPRDSTDIELVACAYEAWGEDAPEKIIGDFALVVWDSRRRELFCARDAAGIRPLYYWADGATFMCASELHQLLENPGVPRSVNEGMLGEFLVRGYFNREETLFAEVAHLKAAHFIRVSACGVARRRYFDLQPDARIRLANDDEYAACFLDLLRKSVACRMRSDGPIVADLSGGLDSSTIVSIAAEHLAGENVGTRFEALSLAHPDFRMDENAYIDDVVSSTGVAARKLAASDPALDECIEQVRRYRDVPDVPNGAARGYGKYFAREGHPRVRLSGIGGDEWLWGSLFIYADFIRAGRIGDLIRCFRSDQRLHRTDPECLSPFSILVGYGLRPLAPQMLRRARRAMRGRLAGWFPLTDGFARRVDLEDRLASPTRRCESFAQSEMYRYFDETWARHPVWYTERWNASMGVEGRYPFYDRRLVEFLFAIPEEQRMRDGQVRYLHRQAMRGILPESVRTRTSKAEFSVTFESALDAMGGERLFHSLAIVDNGWVSADAIAGAWRRMKAARLSDLHEYSRLAFALWNIFAIELWFQVIVMGHEPYAELRDLSAAARRTA